jgi:hypothetical protein
MHIYRDQGGILHSSNDVKPICCGPSTFVRASIPSLEHQFSPDVVDNCRRTRTIVPCSISAAKHVGPRASAFAQHTIDIDDCRRLSCVIRAAAEIDG